MNKAELVKDLATRASVTQYDVERVLDALVDNVVHEVKMNGRMALSGLGVFKKSPRIATKRRNPRTGGAVDVPAHNTVTFKPCPDFYDKVNK